MGRSAFISCHFTLYGTDDRQSFPLRSSGIHVSQHTHELRPLTCSESQTNTIPALRRTTIPISPLDQLLRFCMRTTLGTVTTEHLQWNLKDGRFVWSESVGRPYGLERSTAASTIETFLDIATAVRRLEILIDSSSSTPATPTHHALLHELSTILTYVKQRLTCYVEDCDGSGTCSFIRWSSTLSEIRELGVVLCDLMFWPLNGKTAASLPTRASTLITHVYNHFFAHYSVASPARKHGVMILSLAHLLSYSSGPLLILLHQWVGLTDAVEDLDHTSQPWADLGITRTATPGEESGWEYHFSSRKMPGFIPKDVRRKLFEAGRSLRILREASGGQHPLCSGNWEIKTEWSWGDVADGSVDVKAHVRRVKAEVDHWRRSVRDRSRPLSGSSSVPVRRTARKERKRLPQEFLDQAKSPPSPLSTGIIDYLPIPDTVIDPGKDVDLWSLFLQPPGSHLQKTGNPLWAPTPLDRLTEFLALYSESDSPLLPSDSPTIPLFISEHLLSSLLTHADLVTTSLVSLCLDDLCFLDHLNVLRSFWLAGDAAFAERVSAALFGKDTAGAGEALGLGRRARTRARMGLAPGQNGTGDGEWGMGLAIGLSERAKWPPGGAELAYALRTTLVDDEMEEDRGSVWEKIEDKVSFAIRDLPQDEQDGRRAKWLDPQAIEALDFLYLSYSMPPTIQILLPPSIMERYQSIHNFLLRICRVDTVLRSMYFDLNHSSSVSEPKIGVDLPSRPQSRTSISQPTTDSLSPGKIGQKLHLLRWKMSHFITALHRYVIDIAINVNMDTMNRRLNKLQHQRPRLFHDESRPRTPNTMDEGEYFEYPLSISSSFSEGSFQGEEDEGGNTNLHQLHSIHSLVLYHEVILDRIIHACLLSPSPGQEVTHKILMKLFGVVLDLGKVVKQMERHELEISSGEEKIVGLSKEWEEKRIVFMHALERLSLRAPKEKKIGRKGKGEEEDLELLLHDEEDHGSSLDKGVNELQELFLRLNLGQSGTRG
ncbi:hypothetical protein TREMEDRAFT_28786 [Tremella mesenterica DSM 1558]|uniref:uncharacterized protein n=1 Tax=Tremella mesenterica (strain ATCC 24925 / CBS 8224 / DSM 1558 / NBRC 9311 / NRRL Y-6157 / RJB 2259-6 / UBC 559-6) TaxID=578456 RepID=UPI0003F494D3|nr:uncharacterized protein TREMEDRAFT_28786 [Tremella mesenterica DSM 1558]EIW70720.1 hypothetical protein TREMEDRAFT_28786 [Tremella mesenterica DSM 1558]